MLSILHWRCTTLVASADTPGLSRPFNTPLEMPCSRRTWLRRCRVFQYSIGDAPVVAGAWRATRRRAMPFNTPLEMPLGTEFVLRRRSSSAFNTPLEMPYLKIHVASGVYIYIFQYSIGDAVFLRAVPSDCLAFRDLSILRWRYILETRRL